MLLKRLLPGGIAWSSCAVNSEEDIMAQAEDYCPVCDRRMRKVGKDTFVCPEHPESVSAPTPAPPKKKAR
jgi:hypothetical protein